MCNIILYQNSIRYTYKTCKIEGCIQYVGILNAYFILYHIIHYNPGLGDFIGDNIS